MGKTSCYLLDVQIWRRDHLMGHTVAPGWLYYSCAAAELKEISDKYFEGGQYWEPTTHVLVVLQGQEAHTNT